MPGRSSSSSKSSSMPSKSLPSSTNNSNYIKPPQQQQSQIQITQQSPGFISNVIQGFGLGAGQAIAHNIFRSDPVVTHTYENTPKQQVNNSELPKEFVQCMKDNNNDTELCKQFLE